MSALADSSKKELLDEIQKYLSHNIGLQSESYYTLMFLSFKKLEVQYLTPDVIPNIDQVNTAIKTAKIKGVEMILKDKAASVEYDIDFYFLVLENFSKYSSQTK